MKVLLINPPPPPSQRVSRGLMGGFGMVVGEGLCYPPLDLLYVAAIVGEQGHSCVVIDAEAELTPVEQVLERFEPSFDRDGICPSRKLAAQETVRLDSDALEQILTNLVSNVEKYAATGGYFRHDRQGIFTAGVISGYQHPVGPGTGHPAHELALVPGFLQRP